MASIDQQILDEINGAILAIVTGRVESYSVGGRPVTRLDLPSLEEMKTKYELRVGRAKNGMFSASQFRDAE